MTRFFAALTPATRRPPSPLSLQWHRVVMAVAVIAVATGVVAFGISLLLGARPAQGFFFAVGVTVRLVPEGREMNVVRVWTPAGELAVTGQGSPGRVDECIQLWYEAVAPSVREQQGFRGARVLVQRDSGRIMSIGLWDTEEDFRNTVPWNDEQLTRFQRLFTAPPTVEHFELVAEA